LERKEGGEVWYNMKKGRKVIMVKKNIRVMVDESLYWKFKVKVARERGTIQGTVEGMMRDYVSGGKRGNKG